MRTERSGIDPEQWITPGQGGGGSGLAYIPIY